MIYFILSDCCHSETFPFFPLETKTNLKLFGFCSNNLSRCDAGWQMNVTQKINESPSSWSLSMHGSPRWVRFAYFNSRWSRGAVSLVSFYHLVGIKQQNCAPNTSYIFLNLVFILWIVIHTISAGSCRATTLNVPHQYTKDLCVLVSGCCKAAWSYNLSSYLLVKTVCPGL